VSRKGNNCLVAACLDGSAQPFSSGYRIRIAASSPYQPLAQGDHCGSTASLRSLNQIPQTLLFIASDAAAIA
jgi:hypothetical protein